VACSLLLACGLQQLCKHSFHVDFSDSLDQCHAHAHYFMADGCVPMFGEQHSQSILDAPPTDKA
jgi:hypothetical protein